MNRDPNLRTSVRQNSASKIVASDEVLRMFDYFLSTRGERSDPEIRDRVAREATRRVGEAEAEREDARASRLAALDDALPPDLRALHAQRERVMQEVRARVRANG